jgi:division protein CdvB (Snf7/Vps24/ESCRT-III family)
MNRQMNLPALQRIAMEFEKENDIMDQRQEMMDDAIDDATGMEDEEESEDVVNQVLDEIGIDLGQAVSTLSLPRPQSLTSHSLARRPADCRRTQYLKLGWRRLLAAAELTLMTTTSRHAWTA